MNTRASEFADGESRKDALAKLEGFNDPLRARMLTALILRPSSANDLAADLGLPIGRVRYHLGRLRKAGLAELREQRPRRGVVERVYFTRPNFLTNEDAAHLTPEEIGQGHVEILRVIVQDCLAALRAGTFSAREGFQAARVPLRLDDEGWLQASTLQHEALDRLIEIHVEASKRLDRSGDEAIGAFALSFLFEAAPSRAYRSSKSAEFNSKDASGS